MSSGPGRRETTSARPACDERLLLLPIGNEFRFASHSFAIPVPADTLGADERRFFPPLAFGPSIQRGSSLERLRSTLTDYQTPMPFDLQRCSFLPSGPNLYPCHFQFLRLTRNT